MIRALAWFFFPSTIIIHPPAFFKDLTAKYLNKEFTGLPLCAEGKI